MAGNWFERYEPIPGVEGLIANSPEMMAAMQAQARLALLPAIELADEHVQTGDYRDSIEVTTGTFRGRAVARLIAKDFKANWIEFGTRYQFPFAILRRACDAAGLRITEPGRRR